MRVTVKLYSSLKKHIPPNVQGNIFDINMTAGSKILDLVKQLGIPVDKAKLFFLNGKKVPIGFDESLKAGDEVVIFPLMAGG
jgi:molybdopterin converting factor small subunit